MVHADVVFMSALTTGKPGYKGHIEAWMPPSYDRGINGKCYETHSAIYSTALLYEDDRFTEQEDEEEHESDLETAADDWCAYIEEDTDAC